MRPDAGTAAKPAAPKSRFPLIGLAVAALLLVASFAPIVFDLALRQGLVVPGRAMIGRDFLNCWAGGQLALQGRVGEIYSAAYMPAVDALTGQQLSIHVFSYPPPLLLFLWPLGFVGYIPALFLWLAGTGTAFVLAARPLLARAGLPAGTALLMPAVFANVWAGHYGFVLAALWLIAFAAMKERPAAAGIAIALLTLKPHMGILVALVLLLRRDWRVIRAAAAGTATLLAASLLVFGWTPWANYLGGTSAIQVEILTRQHAPFFLMMPTAYAGFLTAFGNIALAIAAQCLFAAAALALLVRAALRATPWPELGLMTATATFLVLPYAFNYDMAVVGLGALMLLFGRERKIDLAGRIFALFAFGAPVLVFLTTYFQLPILPVALLGFLHAQSTAYVPATTDAPSLWKTPRTALGTADSAAL